MVYTGTKISRVLEETKTILSRFQGVSDIDPRLDAVRVLSLIAHRKKDDEDLGLRLKAAEGNWNKYMASRWISPTANRKWKRKEKFKVLPLHHRILRREHATITNYLQEQGFKRIFGESGKYFLQERARCLVFKWRRCGSPVENPELYWDLQWIHWQWWRPASHPSIRWTYPQVGHLGLWTRYIYRAPKVVRVGQTESALQCLLQRVKHVESNAQKKINSSAKCQAPLGDTQKCHFNDT